MASGIDIYSQLLISTIRIADINNLLLYLFELAISLIPNVDIINAYHYFCILFVDASIYGCFVYGILGGIHTSQ